MKNKVWFFLILAIIFATIFLKSCEKDKSICIYDDREYVDTSLYISFYLDGIYKKYYLMTPTWPNNFSGYSEIFGNNVTVFRFNYRFNFIEEFNKSELLEMGIPSDVKLTFNKSKLTQDLADPNLFKMDVSSIFPSKVSATDSEGNYSTNEIKLMDGYSLSLPSATMSTDNVFKYYNKNQYPDSIQPYFQDTNLNISKVKMVCNDFYLIEGTFNTKVAILTPFWKLHTHYLTNGEFRIIRRNDNKTF